MANEADVRISLRIRKGNLDWQSNPTSFKLDVSTAKGPSPGAIAVSVDGTDIDFSELANPGLCWFLNLDTTNIVTLGRWDNDTQTFYPVAKLRPGKPFILELADDVEDEYAGTGTGTTAAATTLRLKAANAACNVIVAAFEQ